MAKSHKICLIICILPLLSACRSSRAMQKEIHALKSGLYYELTSPTYLGEAKQTVYLNFIDYSNMDYYTRVKRKRYTLVPLLLYNYSGELFRIQLGEHSLTQLYREFLTEALLTECNSSTCFHLIDNQKEKSVPDSACRLEVKIRTNETSAGVKLNNSSFFWFDGETMEVISNKTRPARSRLAISIRLTQGEDCLLDKTYSVDRQQTANGQKYEDSYGANAACLDEMTECLSMVTKEIVEEISQEIHLVLSLPPQNKP